MKTPKLKRTLFYAGLTKDEYDLIHPTICADNRRLLTCATCATTAVLMGLVLVTFWVGALEKNRMLYGGMFLVSAMLCLSCVTFLRKRLRLVTLFAYLFLSMAYVFGIALGVPLSPGSAATTFCVLLFALPLLIFDRPLRMGLFLLAVTVAFCTASFAVKAREIAIIDRTNGISFLFLAIVVNYLVTHTKMHDTLMREMAAAAYRKHLDSTLRSNQNAVGTFRMDLSANTCGEGSSRYPNLLSLQSCKTVDDFVHKTCALIPEGERKAYGETFDRQKLLAAFAEGRELVSMENHYELETDRSIWIKASVDMMKNPYTGHVEAVVDVYNIHAEKLTKAVIAEITTNDYESMALVYGTTERFVHLGGRAGLNTAEKENFFERLKENVLEDAPIEKAAVLSRIGREAIRARLEREGSCIVLYSGVSDDGTRTRKRIRFTMYDRDRLIFFVDKIDVTDVFELEEKNREKLAAALERAEAANLAKTAFLSRVSHDMRTPMNGILGLLVLAKERADDPALLRDLEDMELSGRYLLNIINDTLDVSRIENGRLELHPTVCDGRAVLHNVVSLVKNNIGTKKIRFTCELKEPPVSRLYLDVSRTEQLLMNLLNNAVKFTPEGGCVQLLAESVSLENGILTEKIRVKDNGIGMSADFLAHIFEPFSQEDATRTSTTQGTGLGMTIAKQIIDRMNGSITVESEIGKGTCFTVLLPLAVADARQTETRERPRQAVSESTLRGRRVLLCEDHPLNAKIATRLLEQKGIVVEHAENGALGVERFQKAPVGYYDAVLMDIRMPVMDGLDAARAIRALARPDAGTVPILAMTANAFAEDIRQSREAGMNVHLSKPIDPEQLLRALEALLADGQTPENGEGAQ